jgi:hypothetical protein
VNCYGVDPSSQANSHAAYRRGRHLPATLQRLRMDAALAADEPRGDLFYDAATGRLWARSR